MILIPVFCAGYTFGIIIHKGHGRTERDYPGLRQQACLKDYAMVSR